MFVSSCSAQNVKVMKSQTSVGKRPSRLSKGGQVSMQCSECQRGEKFTQTRVNGVSISSFRVCQINQNSLALLLHPKRAQQLVLEHDSLGWGHFFSAQVHIALFFVTEKMEGKQWRHQPFKCIRTPPRLILGSLWSWRRFETSSTHSCGRYQEKLSEQHVVRAEAQGRSVGIFARDRVDV